jgi:membrane fusion protein, heavy metal efflux system
VIGSRRIVRAMPWLLLSSAALVGAGCQRSNTTAAEPAPSIDGPPVRATGTTREGAVSIPPDSPQAKDIKVEAVRIASVATDEVLAPGRVGIDPNRTSKVLLPVGGRIIRVLARFGDGVEQGQPVVAIESPDADVAIAAVAQAEASERQAEATLAKAEADFSRARDLYEIRAAPQKDVIAAQNDLAQARAGLDTARAAVTLARRKIELLGLKPADFHQEIFVRAPIGGKVLDIAVAPGEYRNDTSTALMTIADLSQVWMGSDVPETGIRFIHIGDRVQIELVAYPGETFAGHVARVSDVLDPQTRTVKVYVELGNPHGRFRPEMFGTIRHAGAARTLPVVPLTAVVQEYGRSVVYVERAPGTFQRRDLTLGPRAGDTAPVLNGLQAGERVVVDGAVLLKGQ